MPEAYIGRRQHLRVQVDLPTDVRQVSKERRQRSNTARILNVSQGGVFIQTYLHSEAGELVAFELQVSKENEKKIVLGTVRWRKNSEPLGIGIQFVKKYEGTSIPSNGGE